VTNTFIICNAALIRIEAMLDVGDAIGNASRAPSAQDGLKKTLCETLSEPRLQRRALFWTRPRPVLEQVGEDRYG
jgi:hypothetical protein